MVTQTFQCVYFLDASHISREIFNTILCEIQMLFLDLSDASVFIVGETSCHIVIYFFGDTYIPEFILFGNTREFPLVCHYKCDMRIALQNAYFIENNTKILYIFEKKNSVNDVVLF